jgi:hypothetical protein
MLVKQIFFTTTFLTLRLSVVRHSDLMLCIRLHNMAGGPRGVRALVPISRVMIGVCISS